jgi:choline dehydrogenase-like flavoprotein
MNLEQRRPSATPTPEVLCGARYGKPLHLDADVVIVGSGAGGAVVARTLAEAGRSVVVLEEGPYIPPLAHGAMRPSESLRHAWRGGGLTVAFGLGDSPAINVTMGRMVGGSSALTGGVCFRIPEFVLKTWREARGLTEFTERFLEPYYAEVERNIHVETVPPDMRSRSTALFIEGLERQGVRTAPMRRNTEGCHGCGRCNFGCPEAAKLSVDISYLPHAAKAGALIVSDCLVDRVKMIGDRAVGVVGRLLDGPGGRSSHDVEVTAKVVVLAAGAAHTPLLLRRSGVAGVSGQVGKNVTLHPAFRVIARFDEDVSGWKGALQSAYSDAFEHEKITLLSLFIPPSVLAATMPGVGPKHVERTRDVNKLAIFGGIIHDEGGGEIWRSPFGREPIMTYRMAREDRAVFPRLVRLMGEAFFAAGAKEIFMPILGADGVDADAFRAFPLERVPSGQIECSSQHPLGSCRMGKTREHSVVDTEGAVWDTRGLYIADGSIVPTSLGVNPQQSIMTLATHIAWRLRELDLS